jgi:hypothetical protein
MADRSSITHQVRDASRLKVGHIGGEDEFGEGANGRRSDRQTTFTEKECTSSDNRPSPSTLQYNRSPLVLYDPFPISSPGSFHLIVPRIIIIATTTSALKLIETIGQSTNDMTTGMDDTKGDVASYGGIRTKKVLIMRHRVNTLLRTAGKDSQHDTYVSALPSRYFRPPFKGCAKLLEPNCILCQC